MVKHVPCNENLEIIGYTILVVLNHLSLSFEVLYLYLNLSLYLLVFKLNKTHHFDVRLKRYNNYDKILIVN